MVIGGLPWLVEVRRRLGAAKCQLDSFTGVADDGCSSLVLHAKERPAINLLGGEGTQGAVGIGEHFTLRGI